MGLDDLTSEARGGSMRAIRLRYGPIAVALITSCASQH